MSGAAEPLGFDPIWQAIKGWDIQREHGAGYHGPTGNDVRTILAAFTAAGLVVVPAEPSDAMCEAARARDDRDHRPHDRHALYRSIGRAMIAGVTGPAP